MKLLEKIEEILDFLEAKGRPQPGRFYVVVYTEPDAKHLANVIGGTYFKAGGTVQSGKWGTGAKEFWWVRVPPGKKEEAKWQVRDIAGRGSYKFIKAK